MDSGGIVAIRTGRWRDGLAETLLAGLPRIVRAADEIRWRGQALMALGLASACYWTVLWLIDGPVAPLASGIFFVVSLAMGVVLASVTSRRRFTTALAHTRSPRAMVHETPADALERHTRASVIFVFAAVILLVFDTFVSGVGGTAALLAGAGIGIGIVDRLEARRWTQAEDARGSRLYLMIRPGALLVRMGVTECFELPRATTPDDGPSPFDLP